MSARTSWLDFKLGIRMMIRHRALTLVGGLGIAVGVAVSVAFFSLTRAYIYPTLPLDEGERIVALENRDIAVNNEERRSLHDFFTWRESLKSIQDLTAFHTVVRNLVTGDASPERVQVAEMTASGFRVARVPPLLGRHLIADDEGVNAPRVVVIGYDVWQNRFAGDPRVVGRSIRLDGVVHTIIGVMPEAFAFPENHRYWTALRAGPSAFERREGPEIFIAGRLAPGVTMEMAQSELSVIGQRTAAAFPETHAQLRPMVMPYTHSLTDIGGITLWQVIQGNLMIGLLLVVITLNVAVLVYARTAARHGEIALRNALGASRARIVAQLFAEALVLSIGAAAVGLAIAQIGVDLVRDLLEGEWQVGVPFWMDSRLRPETILFAVALAVFTAVITGVLPALQATQRRLHFDLRDPGATRMRLGRRWSVMIVAQVAIAIGALPGAVNIGWTEIARAATQHTYPADEFIAASLMPESPPGADGEELAGTPADGVPFGARLTEVMHRLEAEPAVAGATFMANLPDRGRRIRVEGLDAAPTAAGHLVTSLGVFPNYPNVLGARILSGRALTTSDFDESAAAVIVTEAFVQQVLGGGNALGRRIRHLGPEEVAGKTNTAQPRWYEIVGVMQDLETNRIAPEQVRPAVYYPVGPHQAQSAVVTVKLRGSTPADFGPRFREVTAKVDPSLVLGTLHSLADSNRQAQLAGKLAGLTVGLILVSALLLSSAGIYAMMSFTVTQRRREIGIRSALGAHPNQVLRSIFFRATTQIAFGVVLGVAIALLVEQLANGEFMRGRGPVIIPALVLLMITVGLLAALGPARRGLSIQPTEALRGDA